MNEMTAKKEIDAIIAAESGWKHDILVQLRAVITESDASIHEEIKWRMKTRPQGLAVWSTNGIICFAEIWKDNIKLIFQYGAKLQDTNKLFNARLDSSKVRAIEYREDSTVDVSKLQDLVKEAIQCNQQN